MPENPIIPAIAPETTDTTGNIQVGNPPNRFGGALSTIALLIAAPIIAILLTTFIFQSYEVDGPSMETTLQNQDRLIVWKLPRTISRITNKPYIPHRSDIIVFIERGLFETDNVHNKQLIKRVIGLPGERVVVRDGQITIYNKSHPEGFNPDINHEFSQNIATLTTGNIDLVIPPDEVFVCGDNRTNSLDSRAFGTVPANDIVGRLSLRIFPVSNFKSFL